MTSFLELICQDLRCEITPGLGGAIAGLWLGDTPVLRSTPGKDLVSARQAASYPLIPFSNRVGHAKLQWNGTDHPLVQTWADEPHAIHGVGWLRPWTVLESSPQFALLSYEHKPDSFWPFAFDASQAYKLTEHELALTLSITNQSDQAAPVGLGWHPYFVKRPGCRIAFEATGRWEMNAEKLPTHRLPSSGIHTEGDFLDVDHCFDGWNGVVHLRDDVLHTRISANLSRLVVFTTPTLDAVAIEPVSHVNNAINLMRSSGATAEDMGVCVLQPGESMSAEMSITVERTA
jgi:aldose 1-epimerase